MTSVTDTAVDHRASVSGPQAAAAAAAPASLNYLDAERQRAGERRAAMGIARAPGHEAVPWALAFSGGGIRSATFCLGVLQGLMQVEAPAQPVSGTGPQAAARRTLLRQFDYLSTVSGGGFVGSFFISLFARKRLNRPGELDDKATAEQAYQVFREDPPGRLHGNDCFDAAHPGRSPLAWLRENGRYMAASGGDRAYAAAIAIRNWCAMHFVLGTLLLSLYLFMAFTHVSIMYWTDVAGWTNYVRDYEVGLLRSLMRGASTLWWSPAWWLIMPMTLLWLLPAGVAFWMTQPSFGKDLTSPPERFSRPALFAAVVGAVLMVFAWCGQRALGSQWDGVAQVLAGVGFIALMGVVWHTLTYFYPSISAQRVGLTRALVNAMLCILAIAMFATVHTVAQTLYAKYGALFSWLGATARSLVTTSGQGDSSFSALAGGVVALMVWLVRRLSAAFEEKEREGWLAKFPLGAMVDTCAVVLLFLVAMFWAQLVVWIQWHGAAPDIWLLQNVEAHRVVVLVLGIVFLLSVGLAVTVGRFPGFLNLSTLQGYYSERVTRAFLGASNGARFDARNGDRRVLSVAHPESSDLIMLDQYYGNALAPMHIINVCMNQTIDPAEQLVQSDRKGKPLAILPSGFTVDGMHYDMPESVDARGLSARLTVGEWVGVSGAAIATGMGRAGGSGRALLYGLANLRLGRWWESGVFKDYPTRAKRYARQTFKTQTYLLDELFARFYGAKRPLQYLSDGGHFENMALYELLRPERGIRLMVACDCGCDPQYQFADLANLMRMVRIDFGVEIEVDRKIAATAVFSQIFGTPEQFQAGCSDEHAAHKCALLLNVYHSDESYHARRPDARVVVVKPRLVPQLCADLVQYQATHGDFPQEATADQCYDEAQWESYRKLGLETTKLVFGAGIGADRDGYCDALWRVLLRR